ncbi:MAG: hypothetical protein NC099_04340 [Corallococcus sp.]|nr:hypothetical protein [Corallococcus sp.]
MPLLEITNDLFDIAARLRSVQDSYRVYYNKKTSKFEIHDLEQRPDTLAFVSPYDELDSRTVDYALYSRVENAERFFADLETRNAQVEKNAVERNVNSTMEIIEQRRRYERK